MTGIISATNETREEHDARPTGEQEEREPRPGGDEHRERHGERRDASEFRR